MANGGRLRWQQAGGYPSPNTYLPPLAVKLRLICRDPLAPQREIVVEQFPVELGRGPEAAVRIDDRWLSRKHCRFLLSEGMLQIRDLASRHGTFVNGQPVSECQLMPGDELCVGLTHFVAEYEPELVHAGG